MGDAPTASTPPVTVHCAHDKLVPVGDLKPHPRNPNRHEERQVVLLARIIQDAGWRAPITVSKRSGYITRGHGRLMAAKFAGLTTAPVDYQAYASEADELADLVADNRIAELSDLAPDAVASILADLDDTTHLLAGYESADVDQLLRTIDVAGHQRRATMNANTEPVEPPAKPVTQPGDVWRLDDHRIMCADCTDEKALGVLFEAGKARENPGAYILLTDPPYCSGGFQDAGRSAGSIGTRDTTQIANDQLSTRGYVKLMERMLAIAPTSLAYVFTDWRQWVNLFDVVEGAGYGVRNMIVWDKGTPGMGAGWRMQHELVMCALRAGKTPFDPKRAQGNVIQATRTGNPHHPTQKPVDLLTAILSVTRPGAPKTVYDPFTGAGSTLLACELTGFMFNGMELSPGFVDVTVQRWEEATGGKANRNP